MEQGIEFKDIVKKMKIGQIFTIKFNRKGVSGRNRDWDYKYKKISENKVKALYSWYEDKHHAEAYTLNYVSRMNILTTDTVTLRPTIRI